MPKLGRIGAERGRFLALGFGATFLGVFVSATGTLVAPFVASAAPDRRQHAPELAEIDRELAANRADFGDTILAHPLDDQYHRERSPQWDNSTTRCGRFVAVWN